MEAIGSQEKTRGTPSWGNLRKTLQDDHYKKGVRLVDTCRKLWTLKRKRGGVGDERPSWGRTDVFSKGETMLAAALRRGFEKITPLDGARKSGPGKRHEERAG